MPSARSAPTCGSTDCNGACITRTSVVRKARAKIMATRSVIAIFTIVQRRSSRCSRNGLDESDSGASRKAKILRSAIVDSAGFELDQPPCHQPGANAQGIGVANLVARDHLLQFCNRKRATLADRFVRVDLLVPQRLHRAGKKHVLALIRESG